MVVAILRPTWVLIRNPCQTESIWGRPQNPACIRWVLRNFVLAASSRIALHEHQLGLVFVGVPAKGPICKVGCSSGSSGALLKNVTSIIMLLKLSLAVNLIEARYYFMMSIKPCMCVGVSTSVRKHPQTPANTHKCPQASPVAQVAAQLGKARNV